MAVVIALLASLFLTASIPRGAAGEARPTLRLDAFGAQDDAPPQTPQETRQEKLDRLFAELHSAPTREDAAFVAEEIEALWTATGSATADLLLSRARMASALDDLPLARRLIDGAQDFAERPAQVFVESAEVALEADDLSRALEDVTRAVEAEPRHYHAYVLLGDILERIDEIEGAHEAYLSALDLYPLHEQARARADALAPRVAGRAL